MILKNPVHEETRLYGPKPRETDSKSQSAGDRKLELVTRYRLEDNLRDTVKETDAKTLNQMEMLEITTTMAGMKK